MLYTLVFVLGLVSHTFARKHFIVGGDNVDIAFYPWQGSYRTSSNSHYCGCVFIGGRYALTSARCGGSSSYTMEFGSSNRGLGTVFGITSIQIHHDFDEGPGNHPNDISVVTASSDIEGVNISPATIASTTENPGGDGWITGWGRTCATCTYPIALQGTEIGIISDSDCDDIWGDGFQESNMICVWDGLEGTTASCSGDIGGPLTKGNIVYGISSWYGTDCPPIWPTGYTKVGAFREWICGATENVPTGC